MRTTRALLGCLLISALVLAPAMAWAQAGAAPAKRAAAPKAPAAPALPPSTLPPAPTLPPASSLPAASTLPAAPTLPPATPLPPASTLPAARAPAAPAGATPTTISPTPSVATPAAELPKSFPYTAHLASDIVNIRSGPGMYYYPLVTLNKGAEVTVEGESGGFLALRPVEGVYGIMKRTDLALDPGGKTGTVTGSAARVYAASRTAPRHWCVMATLKQGETIQVQGPAEGDMVRVAPPESARVYVVSQFVEAGAGTGGTTVKIEPPKEDPLVDEFRKLDAALTAEARRPLGERDLKSLAAGYKDIGEKSDKAWIKALTNQRLGYIANLNAQQEDYIKVQAIGANLDKRLAELKAQRIAKEAEVDRERKSVKPEFIATGMVARLESLEDVDYPIKFKLVDQNNHPLVVLRSNTYDLAKYLGKVVGVRGAKTYLKEWKIYLVTVDEIEVLE